MEMSLGLPQLIEKARSELSKLIGLEISSTLGASQEDDGLWRVTVEAIEKHSIPDSMDILATYEAKLDPVGNMAEFNRIKMRKRIDTEDGEV